jgi:hypothetical protein
MQEQHLRTESIKLLLPLENILEIRSKFSWASHGFAVTCHCCYKTSANKESCFQVDLSHFSSSALINFLSIFAKALDLLSLLLSVRTLKEATA